MHLLQSNGILMDKLPPYKYSLDDPGQLLLNKLELNRIIREDIYKQDIQVTLVDPPCELKPKMGFYLEHYMGRWTTSQGTTMYF